MGSGPGAVTLAQGLQLVFSGCDRKKNSKKKRVATGHKHKSPSKKMEETTYDG